MIEVLVDRYVLEEPIASGGMGSVYRATDERLGRTVAVKILAQHLSGDPRFIERFRREARAAAALSHPNVANVFDYGEENDRHFIVMEFVDGPNLGHIIKEEGPLGHDRSASIALQVAGALGHAHTAGLVHRDIKPSNVLLTDDDFVKVTDFGIARAVGDATLTATGAIMGTAHYISPEQASGTPAGPHSDVYSLGIVFYEMLTGKLPFGGDSALSIAMRHATEEVPRPRGRNPDVPDELDDVVGRATAKAPEDRYPDGNAFAAALTGASGGTAGPATVPLVPGTDDASPLTEPLREMWDTRRAGRAVAFALLGLALVALILALYRAADEGEPQERRPAPAAVEDAEEVPAETPTPEPEPSGYVLSETIVGDNFKEWEERLKDEGFEVVKQDEETDAAPKDTILDTDPPPGSELEPGQTVTLIVSTGKAPKDEKGPPDTPPGQDKGEEDDD